VLFCIVIISTFFANFKIITIIKREEFSDHMYCMYTVTKREKNVIFKS